MEKYPQSSLKKNEQGGYRFSLSARPLNSPLEFVGEAPVPGSRGRNQLHLRPRADHHHMSQEPQESQSVLRSTNFSNRSGVEIPPPQDYRGINSASSASGGIFNPERVHVFHHDLERSDSTTSGKRISSQAGDSSACNHSLDNNNMSAGAVNSLISCTAERSEPKVKWKIDTTATQQEFDKNIDNSNLKTTGTTNSSNSNKLDASILNDDQKYNPPKRELPVMRNLEICLSYSNGPTRTGTVAEYAPGPCWMKETDAVPETSFICNSEKQVLVLPLTTSHPSWINGSGKTIEFNPALNRSMQTSTSDRFYVNDLCEDPNAMTANTAAANLAKPKKKKPKLKLRPIIIDGHSVALWHGNHTIFSAKGIHICVEFFSSRGHKNITAFVPNLKASTTAVLHSEVLDKLEKDGVLKYLPVFSRIDRKGVRTISNDHRKLMLQKAVENDSVIISNENFQELYEDVRDSWRERLLTGILQFDFGTPESMTFKSDRKKKQTLSLDEILTM